MHPVSGWQGWGCASPGVGLRGCRFLLPVEPGGRLAFQSMPTSPRASGSWVEWGLKVSSLLPRVMIGRGP